MPFSAAEILGCCRDCPQDGGGHLRYLPLAILIRQLLLVARRSKEQGTTDRKNRAPGDAMDFRPSDLRSAGRSRIPTGDQENSTNTYRKLVLILQKSLKISGNLRECMGECNLGILHPPRRSPRTAEGSRRAAPKPTGQKLERVRSESPASGPLCQAQEESAPASWVPSLMDT